MDLNITESLKLCADRRKVSYTDIARKLNKSPQAVSQMFKKGIKSFADAEAIAGAIGVKIKIDIIEK